MPSLGWALRTMGGGDTVPLPASSLLHMELRLTHYPQPTVARRSTTGMHTLPPSSLAAPQGGSVLGELLPSGKGPTPSNDD